MTASPRKVNARRCARCDSPFDGAAHGVYCSSACRQAAYRRRKAGSAPAAEAATDRSDALQATFLASPADERAAFLAYLGRGVTEDHITRPVHELTTTRLAQDGLSSRTTERLLRARGLTPGDVIVAWLAQN